MALVLGSQTSRTITIEAIEPLENSQKKHTFRAEFPIIPTKQWSQEIKEETRAVVDVLDEHLINIPDLKDEDGNDISFTYETKQAVLNTPWLILPLWKAFLAVQNGLTDSEYRKQLAKN